MITKDENSLLQVFFYAWNFYTKKCVIFHQTSSSPSLVAYKAKYKRLTVLSLYIKTVDRHLSDQEVKPSLYFHLMTQHDRASQHCSLPHREVLRPVVSS